ncbi:uncharacterized protein LOC106153253 isoform X2 [Lingula anatina]|uniref:Uncharacterized protein LOC106153253 isoform X2 n=1 Tax=Lingula anatina TaxID=7574 RepID=A0A1S3HBQ2_LINAN|nr:uncharacterized protein LOC106153253 isoform X2 [Lingula anatina]|eukprot:XP_013382564.1 uncharacterized protein LOC106153253 isoform X2 [Lingula anatina]
MAGETDSMAGESSEYSDSESETPTVGVKSDWNFNRACASSSPISVLRLADLEISDEECFCSRLADVTPWDYDESATAVRDTDNRQKHGKHKRHKDKHYMLPTKAWGVSRIKKSTVEPDPYQFQHYTNYRQYMEEYRTRHGYSAKATTPEKNKQLENGLGSSDPYFQKICPNEATEIPKEAEGVPNGAANQSPDETVPLPKSAPASQSIPAAPSSQTGTESPMKQKPCQDDPPTSPRKPQNTTEKLPRKTKFSPESNSSESDGHSKGNGDSFAKGNVDISRRSVLPKLTPRRGEPGVRLAPETIALRPSADSEEAKLGAGNPVIASYVTDNFRENKHLPTPSNPLEEFREHARSQKRKTFGLKSVHSVDILSVIKKYAAKARELYPQLAATGPGIDPKPITVRTLGQPAQRQLPKLNVRSILLKSGDHQNGTDNGGIVSSEGGKPRNRPPTPMPNLLLQALTNPEQYEQCLARLKQAEDLVRPRLPSSDSEDGQGSSRLTRSDSFKWELGELRKAFKRRDKMKSPLSKSDPTGQSLKQNSDINKKSFDNQKISFSTTEGVYKYKVPSKERKDPKKLDITGFPYRTREQHEAFYARLKKYKAQDG